MPTCANVARAQSWNDLRSRCARQKPTLRGAPAELPFQIDALALGSKYTFEARSGDLDLLGWVEPLGEYEAVAMNADALPFGRHELLVVSLHDPIKVWQHFQRPKD
ncbi:MAG: hypothetical protein HRF50_08385 [Phycisphaerae bacterium]|jgi:hypothetical protein